MSSDKLQSKIGRSLWLFESPLAELVARQSDLCCDGQSEMALRLEMRAVGTMMVIPPVAEEKFALFW